MSNVPHTLSIIPLIEAGGSLGTWVWRECIAAAKRSQTVVSGNPERS